MPDGVAVVERPEVEDAAQEPDVRLSEEPGEPAGAVLRRVERDRGGRGHPAVGERVGGGEEIGAVVGVQMRDPDRGEPRRIRVPLQLRERPCPRVQPHLGPATAQQVPGAGAAGARMRGGCAEDGQTERHGGEEYGSGALGAHVSGWCVGAGGEVGYGGWIREVRRSTGFGFGGLGSGWLGAMGFRSGGGVGVRRGAWARGVSDLRRFGSRVGWRRGAGAGWLAGWLRRGPGDKA